MSTSRCTSMGLPVHAIVPRNASSSRVNRGVNRCVSTGAMFSITLCLASTSQEPTTHRACRTARDHPTLGQPLGVDVDRGEHHQRETDEHAAANRDEHVVNEQLAREAHEVHPPGARPPAPSNVRDPDDQPQRNRQVQDHQQSGIAAAGEWVRVGHDGCHGERHGQPCGSRQVERPLPGEVAREQRQHEEGRVAGVEHIGLVVDDERLTEQPGQLDGDARCHCEAQDHEPLDVPRRVRIARVHRARRPAASTTARSARARTRVTRHRRLPIRLTATRNASSAARPVVDGAPQPDRADASSSSSTSDSRRSLGRRRSHDRHSVTCRSSVSSCVTMSVPVPIPGSACHVVGGHRELHPDAAQRGVHHLPVPPLGRQVRPSRLSGDAVVLPAPPAALRRVAQRALEVGEPLQAGAARGRAFRPSTGRCPPESAADPLDDRVAVAVALGQDRQHERRGRGGYQVLTDVRLSARRTGSPGTPRCPSRP